MENAKNPEITEEWLDTDLGRAQAQIQQKQRHDWGTRVHENWQDVRNNNTDGKQDRQDNKNNSGLQRRYINQFHSV